MTRLLALGLIALVLAACSSAGTPADGQDGVAAEPRRPSDTPTEPEVEPPTPDPQLQQEDPSLINPRVTEFDSYVPPQLVPLDGIRPVYEPKFATAAEAPLNDDELVIGIEIEGEAKAYPITVLRFREMVNDELAGLPILVTW